MKQDLKVGKVHRLMDEAEQIRKHATLPPCHPATLPPCHPATLPPCHPATLPHLTTDQRRALMREADKYEAKARWLAQRKWTALDMSQRHG